ncbi:MAG: Trk system potassium transporter TrkA [Parvularculaceae bacterium]
MRIIICGAGRVGFSIAQRLTREDNDIVIIDRSETLIRDVTETMDARGVVGHAAHPDTLSRAGAAEADMIIAVTFHDEVNMVACQVAHSLFSVPMKIARVRARDYLRTEWRDLFSRSNMPIDVIISPELEVGEAALRRVRYPGAIDMAPFVEGRVHLVGVRLERDCPLINTPLNQLSELFPDLKAIVVAIHRSGKLFRPDPADQLAIGDNVYFVADTEQISRTLNLFGHAEDQARRFVIMGGGNIGLYVAQELERSPSLKVRLIEHKKERAELAAAQLKRTIVLHGDAMDREILREAKASEAEFALGLTNSDHVNLLAGVLAREEGALRTLALVNDRDLMTVAGPIGVDALIDPRAATVSTILRHVRRGRIKGVYSLLDGQAEILDAIALETSPLVGRPLSEVNLPDGVIIGAIVAKGEVSRPTGHSVINPGDRVVIFALRDYVKTVEQMFRVSLEYF